MTSAAQQKTLPAVRQLCLLCRYLEEAIAFQQVLGEPDAMN
jgi:hypothetical protein